MNSFRSMIRKGGKLWYLDQQVALDGQDVTVKFLSNGKEETTNYLHLEMRQHPPGREDERPSWLSVVENLDKS